MLYSGAVTRAATVSTDRERESKVSSRWARVAIFATRKTFDQASPPQRTRIPQQKSLVRPRQRKERSWTRGEKYSKDRGTHNPNYLNRIHFHACTPQLFLPSRPGQRKVWLWIRGEEHLKARRTSYPNNLSRLQFQTCTPQPKAIPAK